MPASFQLETGSKDVFVHISAVEWRKTGGPAGHSADLHLVRSSLMGRIQPLL
jgi:hypothetical protein